MRLTAIIFFILCLCLPGGSHQTFAGTLRSHSGNLQANDLKKALQVDGTTVSKACTITEDKGLSQENTSPTSVDDEDEDDLIKKLPIRYVLSFYYAFILTQPLSHPTERLSFCRDLSYFGSRKFIAQRVLRI